MKEKAQRIRGRHRLWTDYFRKEDSLCHGLDNSGVAIELAHLHSDRF